MKSEKIWKIQKKNKLNSEKIWKIQKKWNDMENMDEMWNDMENMEENSVKDKEIIAER